MGNRGKDGIWELMENRVRDWLYGNLGSINSENKLLDFTPFFIKFTEKKKDGNSGIWELRVLFTCSMNAQNLPRFSKIQRLN